MYGKLFASMYEGTLYGHWQAIVTFQQMIVLCDADGLVDMTPQAIAARTSIPLEIIQEGVKILEQPDPYSRTPGEEGKRIALLDDHRPWGWRIINYHVYRDLVMAEDKRRADRERIAARRAEARGAATLERHRAVSRNMSHGVADSRVESHNVANVAHTEAEAEVEAEAKNKRKRALRASRVPTAFVPDLDFARSQISDVDAEREAQKFRDWEFKTPRSDWAAAWRNWIGRCRETGQYAKKGNGRGEWL